MNKRANLYLNIYELLSFVFMVCFMESYLYFNQLLPIYRTLLLIVSMISGILFISMELFLFLLLNKKSKAVYILYLLIDLGLAVYLTIKIPFAGFVVFLLFSTIKNILRVLLVKVIYIPKEFDRYCKMFGIKVRDFKKTRRRVKKAQIIEIPVEKEEKVKTPKKKKTSKKKVEQEATI